MITSSAFTYNKQKVIQALRYHFISRKEIKLLLLFVNVFAVLSAVLFYSKEITPLAFLLSSALWFMLMLSFWFLLPYYIYKKAGTFKDEFSIQLADEGFTIYNERGERFWKWVELSSWIESPFFFHLYFNPRSFFIIPKDAFAAEQQTEVSRFFSSKIQKK